MKKIIYPTLNMLKRKNFRKILTIIIYKESICIIIRIFLLSTYGLCKKFANASKLGIPNLEKKPSINKMYCSIMTITKTIKKKK